AERAFCAACHRATAGNPLLLGELLKTLEAEGVRPDAAHANVIRDIGPRAVSHTVLLRLARLSDDALAVARAIAVLGDGARLAVRAALAGLDEQRVADATRALVRAEILRAEPPLGFVHQLVRDAVYRELSPAERELQHERAAEVLTELGAPPELVAAHLLGVPARANQKVAAALRTAGWAARLRGDSESAMSYLRRGPAGAAPAGAGLRRGGRRRAGGGRAHERGVRWPDESRAAGGRGSSARADAVVHGDGAGGGRGRAASPGRSPRRARWATGDGGVRAVRELARRRRAGRRRPVGEHPRASGRGRARRQGWERGRRLGLDAPRRHRRPVRRARAGGARRRRAGRRRSGVHAHRRRRRARAGGSRRGAGRLGGGDELGAEARRDAHGLPREHMAGVDLAPAW